MADLSLWEGGRTKNWGGDHNILLSGLRHGYIRDDIKSSSKFAIFSCLKIEGSKANYEKITP